MLGCVAKYKSIIGGDIKQFQVDLLRRLHLIAFLGYFAADLIASIVLFRLSSTNVICIWYPSIWVYGMEHLVSIVCLVTLIAVLWWAMGNKAYWESLCRSHNRAKVLAQAGLAGIVVDLFSSFVSRYMAQQNVDVTHLLAEGSMAPWLLLRTLLWVVTYSLTVALVLALLQPDKHRELLHKRRV